MKNKSLAFITATKSQRRAGCASRASSYVYIHLKIITLLHVKLDEMPLISSLLFFSETDYPMSKEIISAHLRPKFKATSILKSHSSDPCMNNISQSTSSSLCASHFRIRTQKEEEKNSATLVKTFCKGFLFVYNFRWGGKIISTYMR